MDCSPQREESNPSVELLDTLSRDTLTSFCAEMWAPPIPSRERAGIVGPRLALFTPDAIPPRAFSTHTFFHKPTSVLDSRDCNRTRPYSLGTRAPIPFFRSGGCICFHRSLRPLRRHSTRAHRPCRAITSKSPSLRLLAPGPIYRLFGKQ